MIHNIILANELRPEMVYHATGASLIDVMPSLGFRSNGLHVVSVGNSRFYLVDGTP